MSFLENIFQAFEGPELFSGNGNNEKVIKKLKDKKRLKQWKRNAHIPIMELSRP